MSGAWFSFASIVMLEFCKNERLSPCKALKADKMDGSFDHVAASPRQTAVVATQNLGSACHGHRPADAIRQSLRASEEALTR